MGEKKKKAETVWFSLKKSLHCKWEASDVQNPMSRKQLSSILSRKAGGCSRSLRDVIHGSKRQPPIAAASSSPRSIGSTEFLNPIAHEVILSNSTCELKITAGFNKASYFNPSFRNSATPTFTPPRSTFSQRHDIITHKRSSFEKACHKCGHQFAEWDALESHHLSNHAVSELLEGDSSRRIVEIICGLKSERRIERILKVHNMQKKVAGFEEYRETVKINASKLGKKHSRCLADGNELLRFYGTTLACSLTNLCVSEECGVCRIIRQGFSVAKGGVGVFTTSTSGRAFECIEMDSDDDMVRRKALIVCRVVAGRVHRPLDNIHEIVGQTGFDSLAGKVGVFSNIEDLYLLNPKALLPCFVVICKS